MLCKCRSDLPKKINHQQIGFLRIVYFYYFYLSFTTSFFFLNATFATDISGFLTYGNKLIHTEMYAESCSGRKSKVENREKYGENLFHWLYKGKNIPETTVIKLCILVIKFSHHKKASE